MLFAYKSVLSAGQNFVGVGLMRNVVNDFIRRWIENVVKRNGCFHKTEIRSEMSAVNTKFFKQNFTDIGGKQVKFVNIKFFKVDRIVNFV